jgi:peroxiredoxin
MKRRLLSVLALMAVLTSAPALAAAPDVPLIDLDGKPQNVNTIIGKGKWVVVTIWAHNCHICASEIHEMASFHKAHADKDARVLGVTIDGKDKIEKARKFVRDHKLPFPNLVAEPEVEVIERFGGGDFVGTPTFYVYDPQGTIRAQQAGPLSRAEVEKFLDEMRKEAAAGKSSK